MRETGDLLEEEAARLRDDLFEKGLAPKGARRAPEIFVEADGVFVPLARHKDKKYRDKGALRVRRQAGRAAHRLRASRACRGLEALLARRGRHDRQALLP
ncbi:MAG: hypothetical protein AB2L09_13330 [Coriobacteriia bacterium]